MLILVFSTMMPPPSTPTYQALSFANAGEASAVEANMAIMANLRIPIPFCFGGSVQVMQRTNQYHGSTQARKNMDCCRNVSLAKNIRFERATLPTHAKHDDARSV